MYNKENVKKLFNAMGIKVGFGVIINDNCFEVAAIDKNDFVIGNHIYIWLGEIISKKQFYENYKRLFDK